MQPSKELIFTYFAGQATSVQQKAIGEWLAQPGERERYFQWLDEWERTFPQYAPNVDRHLDRLQQRLNTPAESEMYPVQSARTVARPLWKTTRWAIAASVLLVLTIGVSTFWQAIFYSTLTAGSQQVRSLALPDGSTIVLNSHSILQVPRLGYGWLSRNVLLTGDAVFNVRHLSTNQPFVVQTTNGLSVEVLGTEFSVRNRDKTAEVVLKRGRVNLHYTSPNSSRKNLLMKPGDRVTLDSHGTLHIRGRIDTTHFAQWRYRQFVFNNTSLRDIALQIQQVFGVKVYLTDPALAHRALTGTIRAGSSDELAVALAELLNLNVSHRDQKLVFSPISEPQPAQ